MKAASSARFLLRRVRPSMKKSFGSVRGLQQSAASPLTRCFLISSLQMDMAIRSMGSSSVYERAADETLEKLADYASVVADEVDEVMDVALSMGVLSINIARLGTFVMNKQTPNQQIWLSSPLSGPKRFDLVDSRWLYKRENEHLDELLNREFKQIFPSHRIDFSQHI